jgi:hypothetical protein
MFLNVWIDVRRTGCTHSTGFEVLCLLGYDAVLSVESQPTFRRNISHPSSGLKVNQARNQNEAWLFAACFLLGSWLAYSSTLKMDAVSFFS